MPVAALVDECPLYDLEPARAGGLDLRQPRDARRGRRRLGGLLLALLASPNVASKRWAFEQYDSIVGSRTVRRPGDRRRRGAAVPEAGKAIAVAIDGNGRRVACDPYRGTIEAVLECAANLACVGAEPLGLTNCLNFGNPEKPAPAWQLDRAVAGLADACEALGVPVVGGNVSLYNEGPDGPDLPDAGDRHGRRAARPERCAAGVGFAARGRRDRARRPLRPLAGRLGAGEAARRARPRACRASRSRASRAAIAARARGGARGAACASAHDVSDGGLACALAESRDRRRARLPGRPRPAGRGARLLRRERPVRRGPGRLRPQRRARGSSRRSAEARVEVLRDRRGRRRGDRDRGRRADRLGGGRRGRARPGSRWPRSPRAKRRWGRAGPRPSSLRGSIRPGLPGFGVQRPDPRPVATLPWAGTRLRLPTPFQGRSPRQT